MIWELSDSSMKGEIDLFELDDCVAYITSCGAKLLAERMELRFEGTGISRVQWIAMYYVNRCPSITQKMLADRMNLRESTVVRLLDRMEKEGLIKRTLSKEDRRIRILELTEKGKEKNCGLEEAAEAFKNDAIKGIGENDLEVFKNVLNQMLKNTEP